MDRNLVRQRQRNQREVAHFQIQIADSWYHLGFQDTKDVSRFLFFFAGLNALHFLCGFPLDGDYNRHSEIDDLQTLVREFSPPEVSSIVRRLKPEFAFFEHTIVLRMDRRTIDAIEGTDGDGVRDNAVLIDSSSTDLDRLLALARIIYRVRCNLVHGSKAHHGFDLQIIKMCINPLQELLRHSLANTRARYPGS